MYIIYIYIYIFIYLYKCVYVCVCVCVCVCLRVSMCVYAFPICKYKISHKWSISIKWLTMK